MPVFHNTKYDLTASICHNVEIESEGKKDQKKLSTNPINSGVYQIFVLNKTTSKWHNIQELNVNEIPSQLVTTSESSLLVYKRKEL